MCESLCLGPFLEVSQILSPLINRDYWIDTSAIKGTMKAFYKCKDRIEKCVSRSRLRLIFELVLQDATPFPYSLRENFHLVIKDQRPLGIMKNLGTFRFIAVLSV